MNKNRQSKNLFRLSFFLLLFILFQNNLSAKTDTTYIQPFEQKLSVKTYISKNLLLLNRDSDVKDEEVSYMSNTPVGIGLGFSWHNSSISFGYGFDFMRDKEKGKTKSLDFQYHHYGRKYVADFYFLKYKGFYIDEKSGKDDKEIELCPDLTINQYGVAGQYVFNGNKFSYKATFDQSERQLKSAGSFILGGSAFLTEIKSDSSFIVDEKKDFRNFQIGVSAGYAYTWIIKKNYFITASTTAGMNFGKENGNNKLKVYPTALPRVSFGYNHKDWSLGMSFVGNMVSVAFSDESSINVFSGNFQLSFTKRFSTYNKIFEKLPKR